MSTLLRKLAEPPPPKGVSVDEWDKQLGVEPTRGTTMAKTSTADLVRKTAARLAFEDLTAPPRESALAVVSRDKAAAATDPELFKIAADLTESVDEALALYENMGGTFEKNAFGNPMFSPIQLAGSPAVAGARPPAPAGGVAAPAAPTAAPAAPGAQGPKPNPSQAYTTTTTTKQVIQKPVATPQAPAQASSTPSMAGAAPAGGGAAPAAPAAEGGAGTA